MLFRHVPRNSRNCLFFIHDPSLVLQYLPYLRTPGGLKWTMVYSTSGFLFALAMDYDLFLFARVYERRLQGFDNASAVRMALEETGPLISLAGRQRTRWGELTTLGISSIYHSYQRVVKYMTKHIYTFQTEL